MPDKKRLLLVTYTPHPHERDDSLIERLEHVDSYELDASSWLVCTPVSAAEWYTELRPMLKRAHDLMILEINVQAAAGTRGVRDDILNWLKSRFPAEE